MQSEFEMSLLGELSFFLGLHMHGNLSNQVYQRNDKEVRNGRLQIFTPMQWVAS
jgi:hypothetical protein